MKKFTRVLFYVLNIMVATFAREPSCPVCSRYDYEERTLERVLSTELEMKHMLKEIRETNAKVEAALKVLQEDKTNLVTAMTSITKEVSAMSTNTSVAIKQMERENKILKDELLIPQIHFYARTPATFSLSSGQDIIFTKVEVNEGLGYNAASGKFTVSVPGMYAFAVQYCVPPNGSGFIDIVNKGIVLQRSYSHKGSGGYQCVTTQAFTRAAISDQIWVKSASSSSALYENDNMFTSFSGVLMLV